MSTIAEVPISSGQINGATGRTVVNADDFRKRYFKGTTKKQWNDWRWQLANILRSREDVEKIVKLSESEACAFETCSGLPFAVTPYYASLLTGTSSCDAVRRTVIPTHMEMIKGRGEADDPLGEDSCSPVDGLVHRYPDRVLFLVTEHCSTYCRYCTRSRKMGEIHSGNIKERWQKAIDYIKATPQVRDVLISGGDPLVLPDASIKWLLESLSAIEHVEMIRIGTKAPVVLPQRITKSLIKILKSVRPLFMSIHFTHPDELTAETVQACNMLADAGIPLGSQTVLLKGVNDSVDTLKGLYHGLLKVRVRPYYLYQCDPISGSGHFRTKVETGLNMIKGLRGHTTGYAIPNYVIDAPGGGGKIPLIPDYFQGKSEGQIMLKNYQGNTYLYPDEVL
ncbi:lysine 2,3-aminomutase YodO family protein [Denitrovibrio acetiphilus DSM 12809]|uniref:L-lysine 2,3-aminomutase n=1 Tax=Denitrovibrio acetiphilus (strain DSM 12809 / NBRC 114555 / N2460) TaxID=522772 RepID=D4H5G2_DENA2|nr:KamA family radical SAM protein [Denitrovibrio acetiphilus]ADD67582.1 lysine 2,3-aminomutase YodO family protein [Denitrovibrio acetiphilus DSM 12809]